MRYPQIDTGLSQNKPLNLLVFIDQLFRRLFFFWARRRFWGFSIASLEKISVMLYRYDRLRPAHKVSIICRTHPLPTKLNLLSNIRFSTRCCRLFFLWYRFSLHPKIASNFLQKWVCWTLDLAKIRGLVPLRVVKTVDGMTGMLGVNALGLVLKQERLKRCIGYHAGCGIARFIYKIYI